MKTQLKCSLSAFYRFSLIEKHNEYIQDFNQKFKIPLKFPKKLKSHIKKFRYYIVKSKGFQYVVRFYVKNVVNKYSEEKKIKLFK